MPTPTRFHKFAGLMLLVAQLAAAASLPTQRFAISPQQVAEALASSGLRVSPTQVTFLSGVSAVSAHALLQVVGKEGRAAGTAMVRLRCYDHRECLPFYVLLRIPEAKPVDHGAGNTMLQPASHKRPLLENTSSPRVVRGGDTAILVLESAASRIRLPVICLENGVLGQKIRVASKDHQRFFAGEVVGAGILKGSL